MPRRVIRDELAAKAASLHRGGQSYRAIGAALGIDPRTAKGLADRVAAGNQQEHWELVERTVDVQYLGEHYQLLLYTGAGVLRAVETHPKNAGSTVESEVWLTSQVGAALAQARDLLLGRGIATDPGLDGDVEVPSQVCQLLLEGLKEHEPILAAALDGPGGWTKQWQRFQRSRQKLIEQARGLLTQLNYEEEAASSMADLVVEIVGQRIMGGAQDSRDNGETPLPDTHAGDDYQWVLEQISHPERRRDLRKSGADVSEAASRVESAVVELQLKGRPGGRCSLCPSRGGAYALGS